MKRIAIFCDGTWSRSDSERPTNVVQLAQAVKGTAADGTTQQVFYFAGVGTGRGSTRIARTLDTWGGGALGWGLDDAIEEAFRALVFCYEPGDEIFVMGFSRGAYTARSLVGLIRWSGIPPRANVHRIPEAMRRYRTYDDPLLKPANPASFPFRAEFAPETATGLDEFEWRRRNRKGGRRAILLEIPYLGVWDTVGALGLPNHWIGAPLVNRRHRFHDTDLSPMVSSARHAVAADERRQTFPAALWTNLAQLNGPAGADPATCRESLRYRQEWFPGDHGAVGGGERNGIAAYARGWIAEGAIRAGLDVEDGLLNRFKAERAITEPLVAPRRLGSRLLAWGSRDREGLTDVLDVAPAVWDRRRADPSYRPGSLGRVWDALAATARSDDSCGAGHDAATCAASRGRPFGSAFAAITPAAPPP